MRRLENKDSHLLRQDFADLGPAPNVISKSTYAFGVEAEVFVNYAVTPNIEIGAGAALLGPGSAVTAGSASDRLSRSGYPGQLRPAALRPPGCRPRQF